MFKRRKPDPAQDRAQDSHREHSSRFRQPGQEPGQGPFVIEHYPEAVTKGVARRISPVLTTAANNRDSDDDSTRRHDKGPACSIADDHSHFASALSRRMERYVAELADRTREAEAPTLGEALSMCTPQSETQSSLDPLSLPAARTSSKSAPRRQAFESTSPEWFPHLPRATPSAAKENATEDLSLPHSIRPTRKNSVDDNATSYSSTSSHTISSWEPSAQHPRAALTAPRRQQGVNQLLVLGGPTRMASASPRLQNPAALLLGPRRSSHSQAGRRRKEESCAQALAAIPIAKPDRVRTPSFSTATSR